MYKFIIIFIFVLLVYYISSFVISFSIIAKCVSNNDTVLLKKYVNFEQLNDNYYDDIYNNEEKIKYFVNKKLENKSIKVSNELSNFFLNKLISNVAISLSNDFSNTETMLFFYYNSNEIDKYLKKLINNFGEYDFDKYMQEKSGEISEERSSEKTINNEELKNDSISQDKKEHFISILMRKYSYTDYFFLISPISFKLKVNHQGLPFGVIFKFNGYSWKINHIKLPYEKLIDLKS